jgi:hypothetical protein
MDFFKNTSLAPSSIILLNRKLNEWLTFFPQSQQNITNLLMFPENSNKILLERVENKSNTNLHNFYTAINCLINHSTEFISHIPSQTLSELSAVPTQHDFQEFQKKVCKDHNEIEGEAYFFILDAPGIPDDVDVRSEENESSVNHEDGAELNNGTTFILFKML